MPISLYKILFECDNDNLGITDEGGIYTTFVNNTGTSVKGTIVIASNSVENGVDIAPANSSMPIGVIYENEIENGSEVKVIVCGKAQVLLATSATATMGYWCGVSSMEGRMYQLDDIPTVIKQNCAHIGHSLQTVSTAGSLAFVQLQFN